MEGDRAKPIMNVDVEEDNMNSASGGGSDLQSQSSSRLDSRENTLDRIEGSLSGTYSFVLSVNNKNDCSYQRAFEIQKR